MSTTYIVIENPKDWRAYYPSDKVITADQFLHDFDQIKDANVRIINLCRHYRYLSVGYYCSLLAEARGKKVIPSIQTINDLSKKSIYSLNFDELEKILQKHPKAQLNNEISFTIFFGQASSQEFTAIAREIFDLFPCPLLKVSLSFDVKWKISSIKPIGLHQFTEQDEDFFAESLETYSKKIWTPKKSKSYRYDLAILHNPEEKLPPSDTKALKNFIRVGKSLGINVELIEKKHYARLAEYDALFIRETTSIEDHTYRFAKKAHNEGMIVIDDPTSILRCTNKIYLSDLLKKNKIPIPKSHFIAESRLTNCQEIIADIGFPMILKIPDGSFSRGMFKVQNESELMEKAKILFKQSDLILAQEYMFTDFDWRIGILNQQPIFACQYFMSKGHWQIVNHNNGKAVEGRFKTFPVYEAPDQVVKIALKAANLIGDGLYGVDLKQTDKGIFVIEVNDNPNIDAGVEDQFLKDKLYKIILEDFIARIEKKRR
jgi:glutathione synthase/RimK-type ligase-like ATP-grasp enzyme